MRRCPVKHFQDFPRNPKTLGHAAHAAQQQNKLHLGTRKPWALTQPTAHSPQPTAYSSVTVCKSGATREQGVAALTSIPSDWRWDSVSLLWNSRRHQGPAAYPQPAICLAATSHPEKRLARSCCVDHGTKRLGDLCGSTYDCHDCHERPPSLPAQPRPYLIRASLAGSLMLLSHGHADIVNHSLALSSRTTQRTRCCLQCAMWCRRIRRRALTNLTVLSLSDGSHLRSNARFAKTPNHNLRVKNPPLQTKSKYIRKAPAPHESWTNIRSEDVQMASARTT